MRFGTVQKIESRKTRHSGGSSQHQTAFIYSFFFFFDSFSPFNDYLTNGFHSPTSILTIYFSTTLTIIISNHPVMSSTILRTLLSLTLLLLTLTSISAAPAPRPIPSASRVLIRDESQPKPTATPLPFHLQLPSIPNSPDSKDPSNSPNDLYDFYKPWEIKHHAQSPVQLQVKREDSPSPVKRDDIAPVPTSWLAEPTFPADIPSCPKCQENYDSISSCAKASAVFANATSIFNDPLSYIAVIKCSCTDTFQSVFPQCVDCFQNTNVSLRCN